MGTGQLSLKTTRDCNLQPTSWILVGVVPSHPGFQCVLLCEKIAPSPSLQKMMRFQQIANSSPGAQIAPGVINAQGELVLDANIYKTKMCEHHALGRCLFGRACQNAHHPLELRAPPSTPLPKPYVPPGTCKFFYLANFCPFNDGCRSKHVTFASEAQAALMCVAVPMAPPPPPPKKNIWQEPKPLHRTELPWRKPLKMPPIDLGVTPSKPSAASSSPPLPPGRRRRRRQTSSRRRSRSTLPRPTSIPKNHRRPRGRDAEPFHDARRALIVPAPSPLLPCHHPRTRTRTLIDSKATA